MENKNVKNEKYKLKKQYRLPHYDYSQNGCYFVTICTKNRKNSFGKIQLSEIGQIAKKYWLEITDRFNKVTLDEWMIMPNHVHGIVIIGENNVNCRNTPRRVPTGMQPLIKNSLSSIINHYKGNVKRFCNKNGFNHFSWQSRFYDHILRNENSLNKIREYILNNPLKWDLDKNNPDNLYM